MPTAHPWTVRCDSCGTEIFWAINAATGKRMPIDPDPRDDGNVVITGDPRSITDRLGLAAQVLGPLEALAHDGELYVSHFATCPDAASWQGTTRAARRRSLKEHA